LSKPSQKKKVRPRAKKKKIKATKLRIFYPQKIVLNKDTKLTIKALTDDNIVDTSRDDTVEVSLDESVMTKIKDGGHRKRIKLNKGEADVYLVTARTLGAFGVKVEWIEGPSPLKRALTTLFAGNLAI
jgi:hypothetical protein